VADERRRDVGDPYFGRGPTSHERASGRPWDASYTDDGPAPWDIAGPQPAVVRVAAAGGFRGAVLDAGCGAGDNALHLASQGAGNGVESVVGVDVAATAVELAREKAAEQGVGARFEVADAFDLAALGLTFDSVLDSGLFHTFDTDERDRYAESLAAVARPGAVLHVLCFGDEGPDTGPHPVTRDQLRAAFDPGRGWEVEAIVAERVRTRFHGEDGAPAWLATVRRGR
jgi:SAM-dependent methyltransferase